MAVNIDRSIDYGPYYCGGSGNYGEYWQGSIGDLKAWERAGKDSGWIKFDAWFRHQRHWIQWVVPGRNMHNTIRVNDVDIISGGVMQNYNQCNGSWSNAVYVSGEVKLKQTPSNPYGTLNIDLGQYWAGASNPNNFFSYRSDFGSYPAIYTLNNNYKILPPTGLTATLDEGKNIIVRSHCSLTSWSANTNIKGTPYTGDGGRDWNFKAELREGNTVIASQTFNTGETKTASVTFDRNSNPLRVGHTYYVRWTASNDYQQTVYTDTPTFSPPCLGYIVDSNGAQHKIAYYSITDSVEEGEGVKFSYRFATES